MPELYMIGGANGSGKTTVALALLTNLSVNRFLLREQYDPKDLFDEIQVNIDLIGGTLSGHDISPTTFPRIPASLRLSCGN